MSLIITITFLQNIYKCIAAMEIKVSFQLQCLLKGFALHQIQYQNK